MENNIMQYNKEEQQVFLKNANIAIKEGIENTVFFVDPCDTSWQKTEIVILIDDRYYKKLTPTDSSMKAFVLENQEIKGNYSYIIKQFDKNANVLFEDKGTFNFKFKYRPTGPQPGDAGTVKVC